ncbi:uncharacterized protein LOC120079222 [Benincasa hispida]|uniref:uncharacterized protein LOC120079222 n=1 Tax=Benincasa hispida TaxID=102211 RepID=UPI0018FFE038|nr:uncharacterized protein LOC120079222 [Benincasa hispida]
MASSSHQGVGMRGFMKRHPAGREFKRRVKRFKMEGAKPVGNQLTPHFKLSATNNLKNSDEDHINHIKEAKVLYRQNEPSNDEVYGYVDVDYARDLDRRLSLSGYGFLWGNNLKSWKASLQSVLALFTTEAELITLSEAVKEGLWLNGLLNNFNITQIKKIKKGEVEEIKIHTSDNAADMLTKTVPLSKLAQCLELLKFELPEKG